MIFTKAEQKRSTHRNEEKKDIICRVEFLGLYRTQSNCQQYDMIDMMEIYVLSYINDNDKINMHIILWKIEPLYYIFICVTYIRTCMFI